MLERDYENKDGFSKKEGIMSSGIPQRFPIRFDEWYGILSSALFLAPSKCYVEVDDEQVRVQMGWAFRSRFPKSAVAAVAETNKNPLSRGVHGFAGRWLGERIGTGHPDDRPHTESAWIRHGLSGPVAATYGERVGPCGPGSNTQELRKPKPNEDL